MNQLRCWRWLSAPDYSTRRLAARPLAVSWLSMGAPSLGLLGLAWRRRRD